MIIIKNAIIEELIVESDSADIELNDCKIQKVIVKESSDEPSTST